MDPNSPMYREKYLKYKQKYLEIKEINYGGSLKKLQTNNIIKLAQEKSKELVSIFLENINKNKKLFSNAENTVMTTEFEKLFNSKSGDIIKNIKEYNGYKTEDTEDTKILIDIIKKYDSTINDGSMETLSNTMFNKGLIKVYDMLQSELTTQNIDDLPSMNENNDIKINIENLIRIKTHFNFIKECKPLELLQDFDKCDRNKIDTFKKYNAILKNIDDYFKQIKILVKKYDDELDIQKNKLTDNIKKIKINNATNELKKSLESSVNSVESINSEKVDSVYKNSIQTNITDELKKVDASIILIENVKTLKTAIYGMKFLEN